MGTVCVLKQLLEAEGHALQVARMPNIVKQWEGIAQIILRKIDMEQKYIARLEGECGSGYYYSRECVCFYLCTQSVKQ